MARSWRFHANRWQPTATGPAALGDTIAWRAERPCFGRTLLLRHELQRRRSRLGRKRAFDDALGVPAVLLPVRMIDPGREGGVRLDEPDVRLDTSRSDPAFVASL